MVHWLSNMIYKYLNHEQVLQLPDKKFSWKKAYEYAKLMEMGIKFPPVRVYLNDKGILNYNDGHHRVAAAKLSGMKLFVKESK